MGNQASRKATRQYPALRASSSTAQDQSRYLTDCSLHGAPIQAASDYIDLLEGCHVQISVESQGNPEENEYAEQLIGTIKEEEVDLSEHSDFADAYTQIGHSIEEVYQRKRIHSALDYITSVEFEAAWEKAQAERALLPRTAENVSNSMGPLHSVHFPREAMR